MIDMEAKISAMRFTLLDHPFSFVNQVLYFQTKSILDVLLDYDYPRRRPNESGGYFNGAI